MLEDVQKLIPVQFLEKAEKKAKGDSPLIGMKYQGDFFGDPWYEGQSEEKEPTIYEVFRYIWRVLFTPSPPVAQRIESNFERMQLAPGEFATTHIRALYAVKEEDRPKRDIEQLAKNAIRCASNLRPGGPFFVAPDSTLAVQVAIHYGKEHNVTVVSANHSREPLHVDFHNESDTRILPADFYDGFVDLYLMGAIRCTTVGKGGFAEWGHLLGYNFTCAIKHHGMANGKHVKGCKWQDALDGNQTMPGYASEEERIQLQQGASHITIPKYHAPME